MRIERVMPVETTSPTGPGGAAAPVFPACATLATPPVCAAAPEGLEVFWGGPEPELLLAPDGDPWRVFRGLPAGADPSRPESPSGITWFTTDRSDALDYEPALLAEAHLLVANLADLDRRKVKTLLRKAGFDPEDLFSLTEEGNSVKAVLQAAGYDGLRLARPDIEESVFHFAVFGPEQIQVLPPEPQTDELALDGLPLGPVDTASPEFKAWFGDSKVVWRGQPLRVFHGTGAVFEAFDMAHVGKHFGDPEGIFFTNNTMHHVANYGNRQEVYNDQTSAGAYANNAKGEAPSVMPCYVKIENPLVIDKDLDDAGILAAIETPRRTAGEFVMDEVLPRGYDGLIVFDRSIEFKDGQPEILVVATRPDQIKSALSNTGRFDPTSSSLHQ